MMNDDQAEIIIETFRDSDRKEQPLWTLHKSPQWTEFYKHWWIEGSDRISDEASRDVMQPDVRRLLGLPEHITFPGAELIKCIEVSVKFVPDGIAVEGPDTGIDATTLRTLFLYRVAHQLPSYFTTASLKTYRVNELGVSIKNTDDCHRIISTVDPRLPHERPWSFIEVIPIPPGVQPNYHRTGPPRNMDGDVRMFTIKLLDQNDRFHYRSWWTKHRVMRWLTHQETLMFLKDKQISPEEDE